jgi:hypothetical protein
LVIWRAVENATIQIFYAITAMCGSYQIFWVVTSCSFLDKFTRFGAKYDLNCQRRSGLKFMIYLRHLHLGETWTREIPNSM